jgi:hypothetical protein
MRLTLLGQQQKVSELLCRLRPAGAICGSFHCCCLQAVHSVQVAEAVELMCTELHHLPPAAQVVSLASHPSCVGGDG